MNGLMLDSGRSSLRLIVQALAASGVDRVHLPAFHCPIVTDVIRDAGLVVSTYSLNDDLSTDPSVFADFDDTVAAYVIDFFGIDACDLPLINPACPVVIDAAFSLDVRIPTDRVSWAAFTSYRKILPVVDGSLCVSSMYLDGSLVVDDAAGFTEPMRTAMESRRAYIDGCDDAMEQAGLAAMERANELLGEQQRVHRVSRPSAAMLTSWMGRIADEGVRRAENVRALHEVVPDAMIVQKDVAPFPSYASFRMKNRDAVKKTLRDDRVFLPGHWPNPYGYDDPNYDTLLSVPVDGRYTAATMTDIGKVIADAGEPV